jgi:hypothetical protein
MPKLAIARQHMLGVSPVGPYFEDRTGSPEYRVKRVRRAGSTNAAQHKPLCN